jgi:diaminohydroxyphosphoribosylaminopyrimidine deaminase/5-amino-6-(5-phosphoribosylamino)uracil reductase
MISFADLQHMRRAIELAWLGRYTTHPNPRVGCVIAKGEKIVGEGWHRKAGAAHAEVIALDQASEAARGACAYVTLEPHSFHGKTAPCTEALIRAGVARVVCGMLDPNPKVHGAGIRQLQAAGVVTEVGVLAEETRALNFGFEKRMRTGLPRVIVKMGASLDGRIALANGESRWITSDAARQDVQRLRASVSAVMTGIGTVIADDPLLTVRDSTIDLGGRAILRIVLDSRLRIEPTAKLFQTPGPVLVATVVSGGEQANRLQGASADVITLPADTSGGIDLLALFRELGRRECNDVLVEAGPRLAGRILALDLCDELIVYFAPRVLGPDARAMFDLPSIQRLQDSLQFRLQGAESIGPDLKVSLTRRE